MYKNKKYNHQHNSIMRNIMEVLQEEKYQLKIWINTIKI